MALFLLQRDSRHTDDTIHGRADLMAHTGQEIGLRLAGNIMLFLRQLALNDSAQLRQILVFLAVVKQRLLDPHNTDISHVIPIVIHGQHDTVPAGHNTQKPLNDLVSAFLFRQIAQLILAQPLIEDIPLFLAVRSHILCGHSAAFMPLIIQIIGTEIRTQHRDQHIARMIKSADLAQDQLHLRREISPLAKQVKSQRYQADILAIIQRADITSQQRR